MRACARKRVVARFNDDHTLPYFIFLILSFVTANVFVHFEVRGLSETSLFVAALAMLSAHFLFACFSQPIGPLGGQVEYDGEFPPYVVKGSPEDANWRSRNLQGHRLVHNRGFETGSTEAHHHAFSGSLDKLKDVLDRNADLVNVRDKNGWTALHEAIRAGNIETVRLLLDRGSDVNVRSGANGRGGSALWLAHTFTEDHVKQELIDLIKERDGRWFAPEEL